MVITDSGRIIGGRIYGRGEIVAVSDQQARRLIDAGVARCARD